MITRLFAKLMGSAAGTEPIISGIDPSLQGRALYLLQQGASIQPREDGGFVALEPCGTKIQSTLFVPGEQAVVFMP